MFILFVLIWASLATFTPRGGLRYRNFSPIRSPNSEKRHPLTDTTHKIISAESKCCVCYTEIATHAYLCGHRCICKHCCKKLLWCPICKERKLPCFMDLWQKTTLRVEMLLFHLNCGKRQPQSTNQPT